MEKTIYEQITAKPFHSYKEAAKLLSIKVAAVKKRIQRKQLLNLYNYGRPVISSDEILKSYQKQNPHIDIKALLSGKKQPPKQKEDVRIKQLHRYIEYILKENPELFPKTVDFKGKKIIIKFRNNSPFKK